MKDVKSKRENNYLYRSSMNDKMSKTATLFKRVINVNAWVDAPRLKAFTLYLYNGFKKMFIPQKPQTPDISFEEMAARLNLNPDELRLKAAGLFRLCITMLLCGLFFLIYCIYSLVAQHYAAAIISFVVVFVCVAFSFRYHFWYFQIKERKLGSSINDWYENGVMRKRK